MWQAVIAGALAAAALGGCGTIVRGTTEDVIVNTNVPATVTTSLGHTCPVSPCTFKVDRKAEFMVTATAPGYEPQSMPIGTKISGGGGAAFAGNVLFGGVIGMGVDAASGATLDHYPNPAYIQLVPLPVGPVPPVISAPKRPPSVVVRQPAPTS